MNNKRDAIQILLYYNWAYILKGYAYYYLVKKCTRTELNKGTLCLRFTFIKGTAI